jgi:hypothetical protein
MAHYVIYTQHHSISRSRVVHCPEGETLRGAKRRATREFGDGFPAHTIVIAHVSPLGWEIASKRRVRDKRWLDCY